MSYWLETEQDEVQQIYDEVYGIDCPYCKKEVEHKDICSMPWENDTEEEFICPHCNKHFEVRPKYKFLGFYYYTDDEQLEVIGAEE